MKLSPKVSFYNYRTLSAMALCSVAILSTLSNANAQTPSAEPMPVPSDAIQQEAPLMAPSETTSPLSTSPQPLQATKSNTQDPVDRVLSAGLMKGYPDGSFHPEGHVTRAELAHILVKTFKVDVREPQTSNLSNMSDVPVSHWAYDDIKTVLKTNVMEGYRAGQFYPNQAVTRGEGFAILAQAYGVFDFNDKQVQETLADYKDAAQLPSWSTKAVATAIHEGFVNTNESKGYIYPERPLTRGDMAYALSKYLDRTYQEFPASK